MAESLKVETKDASEYYTTEEMAKFKKPKKVRNDEMQSLWRRHAEMIYLGLKLRQVGG